MLGVSIGVQLIVATMFLMARPAVPPDDPTLTTAGRHWSRPEDDLKTCLAGCVASGALVAALWPRWPRPERDKAGPGGLDLAALGVCGLPESSQNEVEQYRELTRRMAGFRHANAAVAANDPADTMFYLGAGVPPADRDHSLPITSYREADARQAWGRLRASAPGFVIMRRPGSESHGGPHAGFVEWDRRRALLRAMDYAPEGRIGDHAIWRRGGASAASSPATG